MYTLQEGVKSLTFYAFMGIIFKNIFFMIDIKILPEEFLKKFKPQHDKLQNAYALKVSTTLEELAEMVRKKQITEEESLERTEKLMLGFDDLFFSLAVQHGVVRIQPRKMEKLKVKLLDTYTLNPEF